jgi:hypothetical protein
MATKRDILLAAGRQLGDTSEAFVNDILAPAFDFVLSDLTADECIAAVRRLTRFTIEADRYEYDTRGITKLTPHYPAAVLSLFVPDWGIPFGRVEQGLDDDRWDRVRMQYGTLWREKWRLWRLYPNNRTLQVYPPADALSAGVDCEITFIAPWHSIGLDDDVLDIAQEDIECVALGLQAKGATFSETLQQDRQTTQLLYQRAKRVMWGKRWVTGGVLPNRQYRRAPHHHKFYE